MKNKDTCSMQSSVLRTMTQVDYPFSIEDGEIAKK
jgi:hypothetical protein